MQEDLKQLQLITSKYKVPTRLDKDHLVINTTFFNEPTEVSVYFERNNYQIKIGNLLTIDKIEDQDLSLGDVEDLFKDFVSILSEGNFAITEYTFLGKKAYSLSPEVSNHTPYNTLGEAVIVRLGKATGAMSLKI